MDSLRTTTFLYIKTHNITGLKYFGKTTKLDAESYLGSGKYWLNHIKKHGKDISTEIIAQFSEDQMQELMEFAIRFSVKNNIVKSNKWANLIIENGLDGAPSGEDHPNWGKTFFRTEETKDKMRKAQLNKFVTLETRRKISEAKRGKHKGKNNPNWGKTHSDETRKKISDAKRDKYRGEKSYMWGISPWRNPNAQKNLEVWKIAQELYSLWEENNRPGACKLSGLIGKKFSHNSIGRMVEKFKSGWVPHLDNDYRTWLASFPSGF
jgi:hypothetical protein